MQIQQAKSQMATRSGWGENEEDWWDTDYYDCGGCGECYDCTGGIFDDVVVENTYCSDCGSDPCICWLYDMICGSCGSYPCSCNDDLFCSECGSMFCNGECMNSNVCDYCGSEWCSGECLYVCNCGCCIDCGFCGVCDSCNPPESETTQDEIAEGIGTDGYDALNDKLIQNYTAFEALLLTAGVNVNFNGLIASATTFLESSRTSSILITYGRSLGATGVVVGAAQFVMAFTDDDEMTYGEILGAVSTVLGGISYGTSFYPALWSVSAVTGVASGLLGLTSSFMTRSYTGESQLITVVLENGKKVYILIGQ